MLAGSGRVGGWRPYGTIYVWLGHRYVVVDYLLISRRYLSHQAAIAGTDDQPVRIFGAAMREKSDRFLLDPSRPQALQTSVY